MVKRTETILFIILAYGIYFLTYLQFNETFFIYGITQWFLYLIFGATMLFAIVKVFRDKRPLTIFKKLQPLLLGSLLTLSFFFIEYLVETDGGKKVVLSAGHNGDLNYIHLDLRSDNTFKLTNSGPMGGSIYRGNYSLHNDTLKIDNGDLKYLYPSLTFAIKEAEGKRKYFDPVETDTTKFKYALYFQTSNYGRD
jgi:hypothetical protein